MFERFTYRARRVITLAQDEARLLNHDWIGTEHLLLGLIREIEGVAAEVLRAKGFTLENVRADVKEIIGKEDSAVSGHILFDPRAKKVLELTLREALQLGRYYIGTEHILLALIREGEGVGAQILVKNDCALDELRFSVYEILKSKSSEQLADSGQSVPACLTVNANSKLMAVLKPLSEVKPGCTLSLLYVIFARAVCTTTKPALSAGQVSIVCSHEVAKVIGPLAELSRMANFKDLCASMNKHFAAQPQ